MKAFLRNTIFFMGWLLSPATFWNDAFINIPLSYLMANFLAWFVRIDFLLLLLLSYLFTNVLGLYLMYLTTKQIVRNRGEVAGEILKLISTMAVYSLILVVLAKAGILKPF